MSDTDADLQQAIDATNAAAERAPEDSHTDSPGRTYGSDVDGVRSAAAELNRKREAAAESAPTPEQREAAKHEVKNRWAEARGVSADDIDIDTVTLTSPPDEKISLRKGAALLSGYRATNAAIENNSLREQQDAANLQAEIDALPPAEPATPSEPSPEQQRQQIAALEHAQAQQRSRAEQELLLRQHQLDQVAAAEIPELPAIVALAQHDPVRAQQALAELAQREPAKFAKLQELRALHQANNAWLGIAQHQRQQEQQHAFGEFARGEDKKFMARHPEFADRRVLGDMQQDALEYLQAKGISEERAAQLWRTSPEFRSAEAQEFILDAVKQWRGQKSLANAQRQLPPVPQRPGTSNQRLGVNDAEPLRRISTAGNQRDQLRAGAVCWRRDDEQPIGNGDGQRKRISR